MNHTALVLCADAILLGFFILAFYFMVTHWKDE